MTIHSNFKNSIIALTTLITLTSCSTLNKSVLLGSGIGIVGGALLGSAVGQNGDHDSQNRATIAGAAIGGVAGGLIGYASYKSEEKKFTPLQTQKDSTKEKIPAVTMPQVRRVWVPDKIEGNKYEAGHYIFILEKTSTWSNSNDN